MSVRTLLLLLFVLWFPESARAQAPSLTVNLAVVDPASVGRFEPLTLQFNRAPNAADGHIAVFLDEMDLTALFSIAGPVWRYVPDLLALPSGDHELIVYQDTGDGRWQDIARFAMRVQLPGGFNQAAFQPALTLNNKGQLAQGLFPEPPEPLDRAEYQDLTGQFGGMLTVQRSAWTAEAQANVIGVSYQNEALRFNERAEEAPKVDLADYQFGLQRGKVRASVGHLSYGHHRYLMDNFGSRGLTVGATLVDGVDVSVATMNGSRLVGWSNPLGLNDRNHRMTSGTFGFEFVRSQPGTLRFEASYLVGSKLPQNSFNQGAVLDAERSRGAGARVQANFLQQRLRIEGGVAGSRYDHPEDPELAQDETLVPVEEERKYAHYLDVSAEVIQNLKLTEQHRLGLTAAFRRERVDPLYQTVAAFVRPDQLQNVLEAQAFVGPLNVQASRVRSEDNLDEIPSILKSETESRDLNLSLQTAAFAPTANATVASLLPSLSYGYNQTHQFGIAIPLDGGFNASHIPDQLSEVRRARADWQGRKWRLGFERSRATQDNRQEGREDADFATNTNTFSVSLRPTRWFDVTFDLLNEAAESLADSTVEHTRRLGVRGSLRPLSALMLSANYSPTRSQDDAEIMLRTNASLRLEAAYSFQYDGGLGFPVRGQVFLRYARQERTNRNFAFDIDDENRTWSVNTGVSLSLF